MTLTPRQEREREFWNRRIPDQAYADWQEFPFSAWRANRSIQTRALSWLGNDLSGKRLLLCGVGPELVQFARQGVEIWGFDISDSQVRAAEALAERFGLTDVVHLKAMPFETLDFPDDFFDIAYGQAILHHIDLDRGGIELNRVLRPGGRASFVEPLGHNPLLNFARDRLPYRGKGRTEDERPLHYRDIRTFGRHFGRAEYREYTLFSMLRGRVVTNKRLIRGLKRLDDNVLDRVPRIRRLCSEVWVGVEASAKR